MKPLTPFLIATFGLAACAVHAAETLSVVPDSAQALGTVGGRFANLHDASAVRVAPANILQITEPQVLFNTGAWNGDIRLDSNTSGSVKMSQSWVYPASLYAVLPVVPEKLAFGFGISTPFGLAFTFPKDMPVGPGVGAGLRHNLPFEARLVAVDFTPVIAFEVTDTLTMAAGLDIVYSQFTMGRIYPWGVWGGGDPDGEIQIKGDGWGLGGYLGASWEFAPGHRFGFIGRLPIRINYSGRTETVGMPGANPGLMASGTSTTSHFGTDMTFPGSIAVGYGVDVTDRLTLGFDFQWSDNSSHDDIPLNLGNNQPLLFGQSAAVLGWQDSIDLGFGATYKLDQNWRMRCGYLFSENSQPENNYLPSAAGYDRHVFGVGVGWKGRTNSVDLAYAFVYNPIRTIGSAATPAFNGNYKHQWHVLSLSLTHRF
ncbi:MAG: outer membrane protein transport protein [Verrucomicrobiaceae bacterium]|jgi:long-chain fatty acid transport protein|nr:outer membrane protein transport protein [Verrucomicrobiaceae bacterium]